MTELEELISKKVHTFDVISLLQLLWRMGYRSEEIRFKSRDSITSQQSLIHGISFTNHPSRQVVIHMNLGLTSAQSPLPSYTRKKMDTEITDVQSFIDFLGFFDHLLIRSYLLGIYPEVDRDVYPDWELTKRSYLLMLDFRSCATLHWLFHLVFPELGLQVEKARFQRALSTIPFVLGKTALGNEAIFGKEVRIPVNGRRVTLYSEEEYFAKGNPWPREIKKRLDEQIFPILRAVGMDLEIFFVVQSQRSWARLHSESYLGFDRIHGEKAQLRRIRVFQGHLRR